jgi:hypothetical protein
MDSRGPERAYHQSDIAGPRRQRISDCEKGLAAACHTVFRNGQSRHRTGLALSHRRSAIRKRRCKISRHRAFEKVKLFKARHLIEMTVARQDLFPIVEKRSGTSQEAPTRRGKRVRLITTAKDAASFNDCIQLIFEVDGHALLVDPDFSNSRERTMTGQGIFFGFIVFGSIIAAFSYLNYQKLQAARISKVLEDISSGTTDINFVLAASPLVVSEHEKVAAVLPKTTLLEPKMVRVREGSRHSSSMRMASYSVGSGNYTSTTEFQEQLRAIDLGTLVVTNQRIVFLGKLKTISIDVNKMIGVDEYRDSIGVHCKDKEKVDSFKISNDLMLTYHEDQKDVLVPFAGQILGSIIGHTMAEHDARKETTAA